MSTLYYMWTTVDDEMAVVNFKDSQHRLASFFIESQGDGRFLAYTTPNGIRRRILGLRIIWRPP